jgi:hypothetical protein
MKLHSNNRVFSDKSLHEIEGVFSASMREIPELKIVK